MKILAIDPGPEMSAAVVYDTDSQRPTGWVKEENGIILLSIDVASVDMLAVEMVASYGMPVGKDVFDTVVWIGRFVERWMSGPRQVAQHRSHPVFITRKQAVTHLCHSAKAGDSNVRQALIDRFGPGKEKAVGYKRAPGPLYGLRVDHRAALAVAIAAADSICGEKAA